MGKHLVFYDGNCGLCDQVVRLIFRQDKKELFDFAPLQGTTALSQLSPLPPSMKTADSLILIENYKDKNRRFFIFGKGAFRICWLLGGIWQIPGAVSWLPSILYDWAYRLVARNRHRLFPSNQCVIPTPQSRHRFLP
ncbi:MAG: DUF393 domain-containing protein [Parachlamydiaceae bacterium]